MEHLRLRQIALVAQDLDAVREAIRAVFGVDHFHVDPAVAAFGLRNCVFVLGDTFLEIVSPTMDGTTAGRLLNKRGGDGGYMVIVQTNRLDEARSRIENAGVRIVAEFDKGGAAFLHLHPRDVGGALLSVDYMDGDNRWDWAGPDWHDHVQTPGEYRIIAADIQVEVPELIAKRWGQVLGCHAVRSGDTWQLTLDSGDLIFSPLQDDRGEGFRAITIAARNGEEIRKNAKAHSLLSDDGELNICGITLKIASYGENSLLI